MAQTTIWHNKSCSKSIQAIEELENRRENYKIVEYLTETPSASEIKSVIKMLKTDARGLMRTTDPVYLDLNLDNDSLSEEELVQAMVKNPAVIQRPVVIKNGKAAIGRPTQNIIDIL